MNQDNQNNVDLIARKKIKVAFLWQTIQVWNSWYPLYEHLKEDERFCVQMFITRHFYYLADSNLLMQQVINVFNQHQIDFKYTDNPDDLIADVLFLQYPHDVVRAPEFSIANLLKYKIKLAYIPYGLEVGGGEMNTKNQTNQPLHKHAWKIFVRSERAKNTFVKHLQENNDALEVTGHPKFDSIKKALIEGTKNNVYLQEQIANRKTFLWTPHYIVSNARPYWSTFFDYCDKILDFFIKRDDLFLIVRPHPMLFSSILNQNILDSDTIDTFKNIIRTSNNMYLDESHDPIPSFLATDALISDAGSFLLEFLPMKKPILYLKCKDGEGLNEDGKELEKFLYHTVDFVGIEHFIDLIVNNKDSKKKVREAVSRLLLYKIDDLQYFSSAKIAEIILNELYCESPVKIS